MMDTKLFLQALSKFLIGLIIICMLLFIPAGTLNYPNGWLFIALLFIPMFIAGIIMFIMAPDLLRRRLNAKEEEEEQKLVLLLSHSNHNDLNHIPDCLCHVCRSA